MLGRGGVLVRLAPVVAGADRALLLNAEASGRPVPTGKSAPDLGAGERPCGPATLDLRHRLIKDGGGVSPLTLRHTEAAGSHFGVNAISPSSMIEGGEINRSNSGAGAKKTGVGNVADRAEANESVEANLRIRKAGRQAQGINEKRIVLAGKGANMPRGPGAKGVRKGLEGPLNAGEEKLLG